MCEIKVSIIIPTYNRCKYIWKTLDSFLRQSYQSDKYEIIICDNNSTDKTFNVVNSYIKEYGEKRIKYLKEKRQGSHYARNLGAKIAVGDILYFTDDDMIADYNLLSNLVEFMEKHPKVGIATGKVVPKWECVPPKWVERYCCNGLLSLIDLGKNNRVSRKDIGVYSCHEAIWRKVFDKTNGFHLDLVGNELLGDGETGLNADILGMGYLSAYVGNALIYHIISKKRMTQKYLNNRLYNQGNCDSYTCYRRKQFEERDLNKRKFGYLRMYFNGCKNIMIGAFSRKISVRFIVAYLYYYLARIKYDTRIVHDENFRKMVLREQWD